MLEPSNKKPHGHYDLPKIKEEHLTVVGVGGGGGKEGRWCENHKV